MINQDPRKKIKINPEYMDYIEKGADFGNTWPILGIVFFFCAILIILEIF